MDRVVPVGIANQTQWIKEIWPTGFILFFASFLLRYMYMKKLTMGFAFSIAQKILGAMLVFLYCLNPAMAADNAKGKVLVVVSSAAEITLQDGKKYPTGFFLNELAVPVKALIAAGYTPVFANPHGNAVTWDVHSIDKKFFSGSEKELNDTISFVQNLSGLKRPIALSVIAKQGVDEFVGVLVPGGHAPMDDLLVNAELGKILTLFHKQGKPTALICHGPVALLSTLADAATFTKGMASGDATQRDLASKGWPYAGYRMTVFSTAEERVAEQYQLNGKVLFYPADALAEAGAIVEAGKMWHSHVVQDRELITGRQPFSDEEFSSVFIAALNKQ